MEGLKGFHEQFHALANDYTLKIFKECEKHVRWMESYSSAIQESDLKKSYHEILKTPKRKIRPKGDLKLSKWRNALLSAVMESERRAPKKGLTVSSTTTSTSNFLVSNPMTTIEQQITAKEAVAAHANILTVEDKGFGVAPQAQRVKDKLANLKAKLVRHNLTSSTTESTLSSPQTLSLGSMDSEPATSECLVQKLSMGSRESVPYSQESRKTEESTAPMDNVVVENDLHQEQQTESKQPLPLPRHSEYAIPLNDCSMEICISQDQEDKDEIVEDAGAPQSETPKQKSDSYSDAEMSETDESVEAEEPAKTNPPKNQDVPNWAQTPNLMKTLQNQCQKDPDQIFGAVKPLKLEDVFQAAKAKKFRDSCAGNWAEGDRLTKEEEEQYKKKMGFA
ncbi:hypothetical protein HDU97_004632 [Phlyctochytrium planicorne]|nr:hypothetical protein HDU97_004632 [Phlyctochytrium planicorne]